MNATKTPSDYLVKGMEKIQPAYAQFEVRCVPMLSSFPSSHHHLGKFLIRTLRF
jgi:hypothetical protein